MNWGEVGGRVGSRTAHCPLGGTREASVLGEMAPPPPSWVQGPVDKTESCEKPSSCRAPPQVVPFRDSQMVGGGPSSAQGLLPLSLVILNNTSESAVAIFFQSTIQVVGPPGCNSMSASRGSQSMGSGGTA